MDYTSYFDIFVMLKVSSILLHADLWFTNTRTYLTRVWNALDSPTYQFIFFDIGKHWLKNNNVYLMITNECELTTCTENNDPPHPDIIPRTWTLIQRHNHFTLTSRSRSFMAWTVSMSINVRCIRTNYKQVKLYGTVTQNQQVMIRMCCTQAHCWSHRYT